MFIGEIILFVFDWRLGLATFGPIIMLYAFQSVVMGKNAGQFIKTYQDSLEDMNNAFSTIFADVK